jgi:flagellar biosynthesis anti-sigma factor FlgM
MENPGEYWQLTDTKYTAVIKTGPHTTRSMPKNRKPGVVTRLSTRPRSRSRMANSDAIALSSPALDLQIMKSAIEQLPEIDAARVVDLHHRIIASEYKVDPRQLAKKMLALEKSFDTP